MGLYYNNTITFPVFGTDTGENSYTRTSVPLSSVYQVENGTNPTKSFKCADYSKLNLDILYTTGDSETNNSIEIKIEDSSDGVNWYRIPNEAVSTGTSTLTEREFTFVGASAATGYAISLGLDIFYRFLRVSAKESGVSANAGTVYCRGTLCGL